MMDPTVVPDYYVWRVLALMFVALGQTLFVAIYAMFPWYATFLGRALFFHSAMLAFIVDMYLVSRVFDFFDFDLLFVSLYVVLGVSIWWQFWAFLRVWLAGKKDIVNPNGSPRVSGNRLVALTEREVDAIEVSDAADVAEAAAIETAAVAAAVAAAAIEATAAEAKARARAQALGREDE